MEKILMLHIFRSEVVKSWDKCANNPKNVLKVAIKTCTEQRWLGTSKVASAEGNQIQLFWHIFSETAWIALYAQLKIKWKEWNFFFGASLQNFPILFSVVLWHRAFSFISLCTYLKSDVTHVQIFRFDLFMTS